MLALYEAAKILSAKHLIQEAPYEEVYVLIADLDEDGSGLGQQFAGDDQAVAQPGEVGVDAELPRVAEGADLFRLASGVGRLAVLHVPLARADLPVAAELDAVGRVDVDHLHLRFQPLLLGQAGHHQQRVAEDHAVRPVAVALVKVDPLVELVGQAVEIGEQVELLLCPLTPGPSPRGRGERTAEIVDDRLRVDFLLDVDGHDRNG